MKKNAPLFQLVASMAIFGTIGLFVRYLPLPSSLIALCRGIIGTAFLLLVTAGKKTHTDRAALKKYLPLLVLSGGALGFNWILLFESYRYTSVAVSTLCYYLAPILVILLSPVVLKETLTLRKGLCVCAALLGMVCLSGVLQSGIPGGDELKGILLGLAAAALYASIVLLNKQLAHIPAMTRTVLQLGLSALVLLPYCLMTVELSGLQFTLPAVGLLLFVGIVHTGLAYALYFAALARLPGQTAAILSYIDPVVAVLASLLILREPMLPSEAVGAVLILGAAFLSEVQLKGRKGAGV